MVMAAMTIAADARGTDGRGTTTRERDGSHAVAPPFPGPAVLYLTKR